jgi:hypothetical protein
LPWYKIERPGLIKPCANQLLLVGAPKKSPARTMSVRTPLQLAASSRFRTTIAQLLEREAELDSFDVFHFAGHWCEPGVEMGHAIQRVVGEPTPSIRQFPWALAYALSPFVTVFR